MKLNKSIKMFVMDVDGTLTNGYVYVCDSGNEMRGFNSKDGLGIKMLINKGIIPVILTNANAPAIEKRAKQLGVKDIIQGSENKFISLNNLIKKYRISLKNVCYIGDDLTDLECIKKVGHSGCPNDAILEIKNTAKYVCKLAAGKGAVREYIDTILYGLTKN